MSFERLRASLQRRVRYRVTRAGALFFIALLLTGAAAFISANNLLFLIFAAMMALLLVSGFLSRLVLSGLEIELLLPQHVSARMPTAARVRLRNLKRITPSFSIELAGRPNALNTVPSILTAPVYFPLLPGNATIEASLNVVFPFRGRHRENLFVLSTKFPFGFLRKTTTVELRRETVVYPALEPDPETELMIHAVTGELETSLRGNSSDFYRIRPYEPHDSARHVDWKSTAHTGSLQVREFTRDQERSVEIYFDRRAIPGQQQAFERLVERCAWAVWELSERDTGLLFRSSRFEYTVPEEGEVYGILRFLALLEPVIATSFEPLRESPVDESNLQIVFSMFPGDFSDPQWLDARIPSSA